MSLTNDAGRPMKLCQRCLGRGITDYVDEQWRRSVVVCGACGGVGWVNRPEPRKPNNSEQENKHG